MYWIPEWETTIPGAVWKGTIYSIAIPGLPHNWAFRNNGTLYLTQRKHGPVPNPNLP